MRRVWQDIAPSGVPGAEPGPERQLRSNLRKDKASARGPLSCQRQFRTAMDLSHLPYISSCMQGPRCSDRQRQPLLRPAQDPGKIWSSDVDRQ